MKKNILIFLVFLISPFVLNAQSGMQFSEFAEKIDPFFDKQFINDIRNSLPKGADFVIWGWDVGDFSGDGFNDVAFSIRTKGDKTRKTDVYLFVDIEGYMTNVGKFPYTFVDLPLEVGVVIRKNVCYITQKNKEFDWTIRGFQFNNGSLIQLDEFRTEKIEKYTKEKYQNFKTLSKSEKYLITKNGSVSYNTNFLNIPSYPRGKVIYNGYTSEVFSDEADYVIKGAYHWEGKEDASFFVKSAYDDKYLYFTVAVNDDKIVSAKTPTSDADYIELWIDVNSVKSDDRFCRIENGNVVVNNEFESGVYKFKINLGNFVEQKSYIELSTSDDITHIQNYATQEIRSTATIRDKGYVVKFKIPYQVLGLEGDIIEKNDLTEFPCSLVVHDLDNMYRPDEITEISTSMLNSEDPSTFGSLILIPQSKWYGRAINIFKDDILKYLNEYGF